MIKIVAIGAWVLLVALGSSFVTASVRDGASGDKPDASYFAGLDYRRTDAISVPIIADAQIKGYILARFVYTIDGQLVASMAVPPDPFVVDEAFRTIYSVTGFDFERPERYDLPTLTASIRDKVNERFGPGIVRDVLVEQFDFLPRNELGGEGLREMVDPA